MHGTRSHARHVFYQGKPVVSMFGDWKLASHDTLEPLVTEKISGVLSNAFAT